MAGTRESPPGMQKAQVEPGLPASASPGVFTPTDEPTQLQVRHHPCLSLSKVFSKPKRLAVRTSLLLQLSGLLPSPCQQGQHLPPSPPAAFAVADGPVFTASLQAQEGSQVSLFPAAR